MAYAWKIMRADPRRSDRYQVRLMASASIEGDTAECHLPTIPSYTRDISRGGLCLIMPVAGLVCHHLHEPTTTLHIILALPTGTRHKLVGDLIYCLPYRAGDYGREYVVGIKLRESECLDIYHEMIESLSGW